MRSIPTAAPVEAPKEIKPETGIEAGFERTSAGSKAAFPAASSAASPAAFRKPAAAAAASAAAGARGRQHQDADQDQETSSPVYPPIAQSARVQGVVIIEATIGPDGGVQNARVLRSIPLLDQAALDAVKQWVFTPTLLNGVPVPVIMTVTVQFTLQ